MTNLMISEMMVAMDVYTPEGDIEEIDALTFRLRDHHMGVVPVSHPPCIRFYDFPTGRLIADAKMPSSQVYRQLVWDEVQLRIFIEDAFMNEVLPRMMGRIQVYNDLVNHTPHLNVKEYPSFYYSEIKDTFI